MSLSKHLQSTDILQELTGKDPDESRSYMLGKGMEWFAEYPQERENIQKNLDHFNLPYAKEDITRIQENIILHYYEKVLPFCGTPQYYSQFLQEHIDSGDAITTLKKAQDAGKGILVALAHFGGVELVAPYLSSYKFPMHIVLRFTTEQFSAAANKQAQVFEESGSFGPLSFIEIGKPGTSSALEMAAALRKKDMLLTVFDEKTDYSIPVTLFGRKVWGGAGLDRLVRFAGTSVAIYTVFMVRTDTHAYELKLMEVPVDSEHPVQQMYDNLEKVVAGNVTQWYFLHEEVPFVNE